jgi:hypothetical protein
MGAAAQASRKRLQKIAAHTLQSAGKFAAPRNPNESTCVTPSPPDYFVDLPEAKR